MNQFKDTLMHTVLLCWSF